MQPATETQAIPNAPKRRRWRWWIIGLAGIFLLTFGMYVYLAVSTKIALAEAEAEASRDLPRWRLMELEEDRPAIPDVENSALFIMAVSGKIGRHSLLDSPNYKEIFAKLPPNAKLNSQQEGLIRTELAKIPGPAMEARKLKDMPRGRNPIQFCIDFIATQIPALTDGDHVAVLLVHDAYLLAHEGTADPAIESCRAVLNVGRTYDGDPFLISHLARLRSQYRHVQALERVLAQGEPSEDTLRELQAALEKEAEESSWLPAIRGERAGWHYLFENIENGKLPRSYLRQIAYLYNEQDQFWNSVNPNTFVQYYPEFLQHFNRSVELAKLPYHQRQLKLQTLDQECDSRSNVLLHRLAPSFSKLSITDARGQALLRVAIIAVACERFRQSHRNAWPESLNALIQAKLIQAVPRDPFDNELLRYRITKEGVAVYSVGPNLQGDGNQIEFDPEGWRLPQHSHVPDIGMRLWNTSQRRQAPMPPVVIIDAPGPGLGRGEFRK
jgi:hypothetical protein